MTEQEKEAEETVYCIRRIHATQHDGRIEFAVELSYGRSASFDEMWREGWELVSVVPINADVTNWMGVAVFRNRDFVR